MTKTLECFCMKCKAKKMINEAEIVKTKNNKNAARGKCPTCGGNVFKFISAKEAE